MKMLDLFAGIGGFSLAGHWAGWETAAFVERDLFCQKVLNKNFPNVPVYGDIKQFDGTQYTGAVDIICGGFPCQPFSSAGKRKGTADDRYLWPEMLRVIREVKPAWVIGENVAGLISMDGGLVLESVCADLESEGYSVQPFVVPACAVGAPHRRDRVWIVAHSEGGNDRRNAGEFSEQDEQAQEERQKGRATQFVGSDRAIELVAADPYSNGHQRHTGFRFDTSEAGKDQGEGYQRERVRGQLSGKNQAAANTDSEGPQSNVRGKLGSIHSQIRTSERREPGRTFATGEQWGEHWLQAATRLCGIHDGLSRRVDRHRAKRLKALGNAIVPQVAYRIFQAINQHVTP